MLVSKWTIFCCYSFRKWAQRSFNSVCRKAVELWCFILVWFESVATSPSFICSVANISGNILGHFEEHPWAEPWWKPDRLLLIHQSFVSGHVVSVWLSVLLWSLLVSTGNKSVVLRMHDELLKITGVRAGVVLASGPARLTSTTSSIFMEATV